MASGFIALNDIKEPFKKVRFKSCKVTFRRDLIASPSDKTFKLSELINARLALHKGEVICFADGITEECINRISQKPLPKQEEIEEIDLVPIDDQSQFGCDLNVVELGDRREEMYEDYEREKHTWISRFSTDERIKLAIRLGYDCDEEYIKERLQKEWPGFSLVNETTFYYKNSCPACESLYLEIRLDKQINGYKSRYGTFLRCCHLEKHNGVNYEYAEAIIIKHFMGDHELIGLVEDIKRIYEVM